MTPITGLSGRAADDASDRQFYLAWTAEMSDTEYIDWSPSGDLIAVGSDVDQPNNVRVYYRNGTLAWTASAGDTVHGVEWSPNGSLLAVAWGCESSGGVKAYNRTGGLVWSKGLGLTYHASWSPNGCMLALALPYGYLLVVSWDGEIVTSCQADYYLVQVDWGPRGGIIALTGDQCTCIPRGPRGSLPSGRGRDTCQHPGNVEIPGSPKYRSRVVS